jgi:GTPase
VALVGYTNAGKSTLFNRLTQADVLARDMLFATLDPAMRAVDLGGGDRVILSDTVGFISDLPTQLVAAFRATLEEVMEADLILHVRDVAHEDSQAQRQDVLDVLASLGLGSDAALPARHQPPVIELLNKLDLLGDEARARLLAQCERNDDMIAISASTGDGLERMRVLIRARLAARQLVLELVLPYSEGRRLAWLHSHGDVIAEESQEDGVHLTVRLSAEDAARFEAL